MKIYLLMKSVHLVSVIVWMAGMFRLTHFWMQREHNGCKDGIRGLLAFDRSWTSPAMLSAWCIGLWMVHRAHWWYHSWFQVKILAVILVSGLHGVLVAKLKRLDESSEAELRSVDIQLSHASLVHFHVPVLQIFSNTLGIGPKCEPPERINVLCEPEKPECQQTIEPWHRALPWYLLGLIMLIVFMVIVR